MSSFNGIFIIFFIFVKFSDCSQGDVHPDHRLCVATCARSVCVSDDTPQNFLDKLTNWGCIDQCDYDCMWRTVNMFHRVLHSSVDNLKPDLGRSKIKILDQQD
jgi:hypothetical protein